MPDSAFDAQAAIPLHLAATLRASPARRAAAAPDDHRMVLRSGTLLLAGLLLATVILVGILGVSSWNRTWQLATDDLRHSADVTAELGNRILSAHAMAAKQVNLLLRDLPDTEIVRQEATLHGQLQAIVADLPQAGGAFVLDRHGQGLVSSLAYPLSKARAVAGDRDFFLALQADDAPAVYLSEMHVGRVAGNPFVAVARRRTETGNADIPPGGFDGVVSVPLYLNRIAGELSLVARRPGEVVGLARADGTIIAQNQQFERPVRLPADGAFAQAVAQGRASGLIEAIGPVSGQPRVFAFRKVPGWPVYAAAALHRADILAEWRERFAVLLAVSLPPAAALVLLAVVTRAAQARAARRDREMQALFRSGTAGIAFTDLDGRFTAVNDRFCEIVGHPARKLLAGTTFLDLTHPDDRERCVQLFLAALQHGEDASVEKRYCRADGRSIWTLSCVMLMPGPDGRPAGAAAIVQDIDDRRRAEEQRALVAQELDHRAKNMLAVVLSVLRLTPRQDPVAYAAAVEGRIAALARAHTLLARDRWEGADLRALAVTELGALRPGPGAGGMAPAERLVLAGPPVTLTAQATQAVVMALYELGTNAVKYGAWQAEDGEVLLTWSVDRQRDLLRLRWEERGGPPPPAQPGKRGFGTRVIDSTIGQQLGGRVARTWHEAGLTVGMELPLRRAVVEPEAARQDRVG